MTMTVSETRPLIGVTASVNMRHNLPSHAVSDQYIKAVVEGAGGVPLIVAALGEGIATVDDGTEPGGAVDHGRKCRG